MGDDGLDALQARPSLGEVYSYQAAIEREELARASQRYVYALERRDKLADRVRFGSLALNGATLAALLGVIGNAKAGLLALGVTDLGVRTAVVMLVIGMVQSALGVWWSGMCFTKWAGEEAGRLYDARHRAALMEMKLDDWSRQKLAELLDTPREAGGFEQSRIDVMLCNGGGSFWIGAMAALGWPILKSVI